MGQSVHDPGSKNRQPQNADRRPCARRPAEPQQIWAIRFWLEPEGRLRDRALFDLTIDSKLRDRGVVEIRIGDLVNSGPVRTRTAIAQQKTGRPEHRAGTVDDFAFPNGTNPPIHLRRRQYSRLVDEWFIGIGLRPEDYGTRSLRRTKASIIYRPTGTLRAVQLLLGQSTTESTARYLGVDVEDALTSAERTDV